MTAKLYFLLAITFIGATNTYAQKRVVENAIRDATLVPATNGDTTDGKRPCAVFNKSACRTITVRIDQSTEVNNFLRKKTIVIEKIGPKEQKFVGVAGCSSSVLAETCTGFKIAVAYYEGNVPDTEHKKDNDAVAAGIKISDNSITAK